jgi:hypothetical protein
MKFKIINIAGVSYGEQNTIPKEEIENKYPKVTNVDYRDGKIFTDRIKNDEQS